MSVLFTCNAADPDGHISEYRWDFDGGGGADLISSDEYAFHSYSAAGTYESSCTGADDSGSAVTISSYSPVV